MRASVILQSETMDIVAFVTARKRSLRRLCFYICLPFCPCGRGGMVSQNTLQVVSQHALQVSGGWYPSMPCRSQGGGIPACLAGLQAHTQGGSWRVWPGGGLTGPHPVGKLRGLAWGGVSRLTPRGSPGPHPGESPGLHPGGLHAHTCGVSQYALRQTPPPHPTPPADGYCCGRYASYWNALLFLHLFLMFLHGAGAVSSMHMTCDHAD